MIRAPFFILVVTALIFGFFSFFSTDGAHDGIVIKPALDVVHGKMLFRETFTQYGALFTVIHAGALQLFGEHLLVPRFVTVLFYAGTAVVLWFIYQRFLPKSWNIAAFVLWLSLSSVYGGYVFPWSSVEAAFFQSLSMLFFLWFTEKQKLRYLVFVGLSTVLVFWFRQPVGMTNTMAIALIWLIFWRLRIYSIRVIQQGAIAIVLGILIGFIPVIFWIISHNALNDWWLQSIVMEIPFVQITKGLSAEQITKSLVIAHYRREIFGYLIWLAIPLTAVLVAGRNIWYLFSRTSPDKQKSIQFIIVSVIGIFSWHQYYPVPEPAHFFWACIPMIGLFVVALHDAVVPWKKFYSMAATLLIFLSIGMYFFLNVKHGIGIVSEKKYTTTVLPLISGIYLAKDETDFYENITITLQEFFILYPDKTYINDWTNSFLAVIYPSRFVSIDGKFVNWGMFSGIYPELEGNRLRYIRTYRPLIFTRNYQAFPDYCDMNVLTTEDPPIKLLVPREIGKSLQYSWTKRNASLRPFVCQ